MRKLFLGAAVCGVINVGGVVFAEGNGVEFGAGVTSVYQRNVKGGLSTNSRKGEFSGSYDVEVTLDMKKLLGLEGSFFIHGEGGWTDSEGINESSVGSAFGVNADAAGNRSLDIVQAYYELPITEQFRIAAGKIDFSGFFDASAFANDETSQFLNASLVNNSTVPFPDYSLGVIASFDITDNWYAMAGVADAQADGRETGFNTAFSDEDYYFYIAETGVATAFDSAKGAMPGTYRLGVWNDPRPKGNADAVDLERDDVGFYVSFDQMLAKENDDADDSQGFGVFFRYGYADGKRNDLCSFYSLGVQYQGLIDGRDEDVFGVGYSNGSFSNYAAASFPDGYESAVEAFYNIRVSDRVQITPDVQYVVNPGGSGTADAVVLGMRMQVSF